MYRQGDIGTSWYAVLSGSLDVKVSETSHHQVKVLFKKWLTVVTPATALTTMKNSLIIKVILKHQQCSGSLPEHELPS